MENIEDMSIDQELYAEYEDITDVIVDEKFPPRLQESMYDLLHYKIKLELKKEVHMKPLTITNLPTSCVIKERRRDYCLKVCASRLGPKLHSSNTQFIYGRFIGRVQVEMMNKTNDTIKLKAGTPVGFLYFIPFRQK